MIHDRTGLFFEEARLESLLEKLQPLAEKRGVRSFLEYYYALKDNEPKEWDAVWEALSVPETYFWREVSQIEALTRRIVPDWFQKRTASFAIWSAGCCTGEEPYSIAMALVEAGFGSHPIAIVGSDASANALRKAETAIYREKSFRALPPALRYKYFESTPEGFRLSPEISRRVTFQRANLFEPGEVASLARARAIFCRNVFIYFSPHAIRQTVAMIAARMGSGGHLFVGASESLLRMTSDFELKEIAGALAYERI